jgi:hypothetical protein
MRIFKRNILLGPGFLVFLLLLFLSSADGAKSSVEPKIYDIRLRLFYLTDYDNPQTSFESIENREGPIRVMTQREDALFFNVEGNAFEIPMREGRVSPLIHYRGHSPLRFYSTPEAAKEGGAPSIGSLDLESHENGEMLVFYLTRGEGLAFVPMRSDDILRLEDSVVAFNLSPVPLLFKVDEHQFQLASLEAYAVPKSGASMIGVQVASRVDGDWRIISQSRRRIPQTGRQILLFVSLDNTSQNFRQYLIDGAQ